MLKATLLFLAILVMTATYSQAVKLVPHSGLAKILGRMHGEEEDYAITIGRTIFLSCSKQDFLSDTPWVRHEFTHVQQYKKYGVLEFAKRYFFSAIFYHSYDKIPFEKEAISAEGPKPIYRKPSVSMNSY
jgi:predicted dienelactone hydrolase